MSVRKPYRDNAWGWWGRPGRGRPGRGRPGRGRSLRGRARLLAGVGVDAGRGDEDGGSAFLPHDLAVGGEVLVGTAGRSEDLAQQQAQAIGVDARLRVIGPD